MVPLLQRASIARIGRRARSGKPRRHQNASLHGMQETSFWLTLITGRLPSTRPCLRRFKGETAEARPRRWQSSRSEEHTSELQSHLNLVCRLLLEKKKK